MSSESEEVIDDAKTSVCRNCGETCPHCGPDDAYLVTIPADDPERPMNWPLKKKIYHTAIYGITTLMTQFNSTVTTATVSHLETVFGVGRVVAILPTSLYILGIAFGPMFFAPLSETFGRKFGVYGPFFLSIIFAAGSASSDSFAALTITRFFSGFFAGAPVVSSGGVLADIWSPAYRGISLVGYSMFIISGVNFGPIISALVSAGSETAWRWSIWVAVILESVVLALALLFVKESFPPVLEKRKARNMRFETNNWAYHARHEKYRLDLKEFTSIHLLRPFALFATPIVLCIVTYASFVFGVLYLLVSSLPVAFEKQYGWSGTVVELPMIAIFTGLCFGAVANLVAGLRYAKIVKANNNKPVPEQRFPAMMMCGWMMPAGMFMFAWSCRPEVHWIVPMIGISIMSCGFFVIFQGCLNYLVDSFTKFAASAIAANTFLRSIFGGVFPLFGFLLFENLGVPWGGSLLAFLALAMTPIPFIFFQFGERLRRKNPYAKLVM